jgi:hypothetical protein
VVVDYILLACDPFKIIDRVIYFVKVFMVYLIEFQRIRDESYSNQLMNVPSKTNPIHPERHLEVSIFIDGWQYNLRLAKRGERFTAATYARNIAIN